MLLPRGMPISIGQVFDIEDPVEDEQRIVYERQSVEKYIRSKQHTHGTSVPCPLAGGCPVALFTEKGVVLVGIGPFRPSFGFALEAIRTLDFHNLAFRHQLFVDSM